MPRPAALALTLAATLSACTTVPVSPAASRIEVVAAADARCRVVGPVAAAARTGSAYEGDLLDQAMRHLRNAAAEQGADTLVISPPQLDLGAGAVAVGGVAYRCGPDAVDGWVPARLPFATAVLRAPTPAAQVTATLPPRTEVWVTERVVNGYRRVRIEGAPTGFVEDGAVHLFR